MLDKRQMVTKLRCKSDESSSNSHYSCNMFFFRISIWVLLHLVHQRTKNFIINGQEKHKLQFEPHDYKINQVSMEFL